MLSSKLLAFLLAVFLEAFGRLPGWADVVGSGFKANALDLGLRVVGLVLWEIVRAERVLVAAVVAHDLVGQQVEMPRHA